MRNQFEGIRKFEAPNQPKLTSEGAADSYNKKTGTSPENIIKTRPFDAQDNVSKFSELPLFKEIEKIRVATETEEKKQAIEKFFKSGNIEEITDFLQEKRVIDLEFSKEILKTKLQYAEQLSSATFLNRLDWKILTGLKIFSKETFEHSIGTYLVIREKIEKRLKELGQEIIYEGVSLEQLYRACLLHDIGKMAIPEFILNSQTTDEDWVRCFMMLNEDEQDEILVKNKIIIPDSIRNDTDEIISFFVKKRIRAVKFVPVKATLTEQEKKLLIALGISPEESLRTIIQLHEEKSEEILTSLGYVIEAILAGNHHNYKHVSKKLGEKPTSLSTMHISTEIASNILHIGDVQQALNGDRTYHHKQPMLRIMAFLIDDVKNGTIDPIITARWIDDELKKMSSEYIDEVRNKKASHQDAKYVQERYDELSDIENFIATTLPEKETEKLVA